jgi:hypothetical protein
MAAEKGNKQAEWITKEVAMEILDKAESVIGDDCYFLSEVAVKCDTYREQFNYIAKKFKDDKDVFHTIKRITNKCEAIVVRKTAESKINTALGIFILKSYHSLIETSKFQHEGGDADKPIRNVISLGSGVKPE